MFGKNKNTNNIRPINAAGDQFIRVNAAQQAAHARKTHRKRRNCIYLLTALAAIFFVVTGIGNHSKMREAEAQTVKLSRQVDKAKAENKELNETKKNLKDPDYVEKYVRQRYMYTKNGEVVFNIPDDNE